MRRAQLLFATCAGCAWLAACTPRVILEPPKEPIVINMNIKIEHEIRVKVDKELDDLISNDKELF